MEKKKGIDVSKWQPTIDWEKVAKEVEFAMLRAGYGKLLSQKDACFESHYSGAKAAGLKVGGYWYSYATTETEAEEEAKVCLEVLQNKFLDLPVFFDVEEKSQKALGKSALTKLILAFCTALEKGGYTTGVYANKDFFSNYIDASQLEGKYAIWLAQYNSRVTYSGKYDIWQYSDEGKVNGISGKVDMNYLYDSSLINPGSKSDIDAGTKLILKNVSLYASATATTKSATKTGVFYAWDNTVTSNRIRITTDKANAGKSGQVTGWISLLDAKNAVSSEFTITT